MTDSLLIVLIRAALIALGTLLVQHGYVTEATAQHVSSDAAIWIAAGVSVLLATSAHSLVEKVKAKALQQLALILPEGTSRGMLLSIASLLTRRSLVLLARGKVSDEDLRKLADAKTKIGGQP